MSNMRARYHELVAEQEGKFAQIVSLIEDRSSAIIDKRDFAKHGDIVQLEYDIHALDAAVTEAHKLAEAEEASL